MDFVGFAVNPERLWALNIEVLKKEITQKRTLNFCQSAVQVCNTFEQLNKTS